LKKRFNLQQITCIMSSISYSIFGLHENKMGRGTIQWYSRAGSVRKRMGRPMLGGEE